MEEERAPLLSKWQKKMKQKPRFESVNNEEEEAAGIGSASQSVIEVPAERDDGSDRPQRQQPSAPVLDTNPESEAQNKLFRRLYLLLTAHITIFTSMTVLFVYVPHLRNIMRRNVFDKLLVTSVVSTPLLICLVLYLAIPPLRKRFAVIGLTLITLCIGWLLSYVISEQDAKAMLISVASADGCSLSSYAFSFIPRLDVTSAKPLAFSPIFMLTSNAVLQPLLAKSTSAIVPAVISTFLMTHFAFNARSIVQNHTQDISSSGTSYALVQMYASGGMFSSIKSLFHRQAYRAI